MKTFSKLFAVLTLGLVIGCQNKAPESSVETSEPKEASESKKEAATYSVIQKGDEIHWEGFNTFTDKAHMGLLQVKEGQFSVENGNITGGNFVIDMTSINDTDLAKTGDYSQAKLEGHLKSKDFFAVDSFPTAKFEITGVEAANDTMKNATHMIEGNLTMRGKTKNITIPAKVEMKENMMMFSTPQFVIDRSKWGVKFRSTSFDEFANIAKDKIIDDNIRLQVKFKAKKA